MTKKINTIASEAGLILPDEISMLYEIINEYDAQCFCLEIEDQFYVILRSIYLNDNEILEISFSDYDKNNFLFEIYYDLFLDRVKEGSNFFPIAINDKNVFGIYYEDRKFTGYYLFSISENTKSFVTNKINNSLFDFIDNKYLFRQYVINSSLSNDNSIPDFIKYDGLFVYLYSTKEKAKPLQFKDLLLKEEYFLFDSEGFDRIDAYTDIIVRINELLPMELQVVISSEIDIDDPSKFELSTFQLYENIIDDYIKMEFFIRVANLIDNNKNITKRLMLFCDSQFGQELGIALLDSEKLESLRKINTIKIYNPIENSFV